MFAARQLFLARPIAGRRFFHATAPTLVKAGDKLPNVELMENSPGNKINLAEELKSGKGIVIGKPLKPLLQDRTVVDLFDLSYAVHRSSSSILACLL